MRIWHWKLLPYLPDAQIRGQWSELNSIFKKQTKHLLINYVYGYDRRELYYYAKLLLAERARRGMRTLTLSNMEAYFSEFSKDQLADYDPEFDPGRPVFAKDHDDGYLAECFFNLREKHRCGQADFSDGKYAALKEFVLDELAPSDEVDIWVYD